MWEENIPSVPSSWPGNHLRLGQARLPWAERPLGSEMELCLTWTLATGTSENTTKKAFKHKDNSLSHFPRAHWLLHLLSRLFSLFQGQTVSTSLMPWQGWRPLATFPEVCITWRNTHEKQFFDQKDGNWERLDQGLSLAEGFTLTHCFPRSSIFCLSQWMWQSFCSLSTNLPHLFFKYISGGILKLSVWLMGHI